MLILCNYDACYHSFMEFSLLACHFTQVHIFAFLLNESDDLDILR